MSHCCLGWWVSPLMANKTGPRGYMSYERVKPRCLNGTWMTTFGLRPLCEVNGTHMNCWYWPFGKLVSKETCWCRNRADLQGLATPWAAERLSGRESAGLKAFQQMENLSSICWKWDLPDLTKKKIADHMGFPVQSPSFPWWKHLQFHGI